MAEKSSEFLWGAATSSHQVEGYNENNDWSRWEAEGNCEGGARCGPATDHLNRFREDLRLAAGAGLNSYRFSVEWSRLEPRPGEWDEAAFRWYADLIAECESLGLKPMLTLHHFTSPRWFAELGGFAAQGSPERFARFVEQVAQRLGARVPLWCTLNEPMVMTLGGYVGRFMPPGEHAPAKASAASRNLLEAHALAYDILHRELRDRRAGRWKDDPLEVGIAHNLLDFMPERRWHPIERYLTALFRRFYNRAWLDAVTGRRQHFGALGFVPYGPQVALARGRCTADFIGVNYYTKAYVRWRPREPMAMPGAAPASASPLPVRIDFMRTGEAASDLEWATHPRGFARILRFVGRYGLPIYVTENGIADRDDRLRPAYLKEHLRVVAEAVRAGLDVRGYFHWSLLDNFEWIKGFGPRFGLFRVDYGDFSRTPTESVRLYARLIRAHATRPGRAPDLAVLAAAGDDPNPSET